MRRRRPGPSTIRFIVRLCNYLRVPGVSCTVFFGTFSRSKIFTKCFLQDRHVTPQGRPGNSPFLFISNSKSIFGRLERRSLLQQPNFFFTGEVFFRSAEDLRKPRLQRAWFSPPAPTAPPDQLRCPKQFLLPCSLTSVLPARDEISARFEPWNAANPCNPRSPR